MLRSRLISTFILIPIVISMLFLLPVTQFLMFIYFICLIGAWEWGKMMRFPVAIQKIWLCVIFGLLCLMTIIIKLQNDSYINTHNMFYYVYEIIIMIWWVLALLLVLYYPNSAIFWKKSDILRFCFGILVLLPFFWGTLILYQFHNIDNRITGVWWLLYITTLVWINDSGAYFIGKTFGKHKLSKVVSPKKTWEGCIGGILISTIISFLCCKYILIGVINSNKDVSSILICSIVAIMAATIGDLTESMFKRESNIKNSSYLIPGHGGILDRIDSLTAAIPVFVCLVLLVLY